MLLSLKKKTHKKQQQNKQNQQEHIMAPVYITVGDQAIALNDQQVGPKSLALLSP